MDWLAEISTDLWEAVAHLRHVHRHVCDCALYESNVTLLLLTTTYSLLCIENYQNQPVLVVTKIAKVGTFFETACILKTQYVQLPLRVQSRRSASSRRLQLYDASRLETGCQLRVSTARAQLERRVTAPDKRV